MLVVDIIGWFGTVLYLVNYAYLSLYPRWQRYIYFSVNAVAATCLGIISVVLWSWQAVGLHGFWLIVSVWLLLGRGFSWVRIDHRAVDWIVAAMWLVGLFYLFVDWRNTIEWIAWSGTWTFCLAYLLFAAQSLAFKRYLFYNAYAAGALLPQLFFDDNWPAFAMEAAWLVVSLAGLAKQWVQPSTLKTDRST